MDVDGGAGAADVAADVADADDADADDFRPDGDDDDDEATLEEEERAAAAEGGGDDVAAELDALRAEAVRPCANAAVCLRVAPACILGFVRAHAPASLFSLTRFFASLLFLHLCP
jgi:hypothetical protein